LLCATFDLCYHGNMEDGAIVGLTQEEAEKKLREFGRNVLTEKKKYTIFQRFVSKLANPLVLLLLFSGALSVVLGQTSDFFITAIIIFMSISIDVFQEHQAIEGAEKLKKRVSLTATVIRDGLPKEIPMSHVVPGDVVYLSIGDIVPADGRLLSAKDLILDESALTGESFPQEKDTEKAGKVLMGTNVTAGEGSALVVATGSQTELGKIAKELVTKRPQTEFEKGIGHFGSFIVKLTIAFSFIILAFHMGLRHDIWSSLLFVLALAITFAPELLPMIITINLSKGAIRMSHKGVIVKSLPAIENFGSMDVLCTDKTGTLTENIITLHGYQNIEGKEEKKILDYGFLNSFFQTGFAGPMEAAIIVAKKDGETTGYHRLASIPFDFYRKRVSVVVSHNKEAMIVVKGAPEDILALSSQYEMGGKKFSFTASAKTKAHAYFDSISADGLRALAVAYRPIHQQKKYTSSDEKDLIFLGFLTFSDPPKKTVPEALKRLAYQGITIKVLTGDNELVTQKVCADIGLSVAGVVTGPALESLTDEQLVSVAENTTIFARIDPTLKERIIGALKANGHVVGFLGDGINDSPSLRVADIGISVNNATDVAKDSADIILLHKDLHVLSEGVRGGRKTFGNVMKYIMMGTSSNFGNTISLTLGSLVLPFLPMLPVQILLNDLLYDVSQLFVASDKVDEAYLTKPRKWDMQSLRRFMVVFGPANSLFDVVTFFLLLRFFHASIPLFQTGWFVENMVLQTLIVLSIRTAVVPFWKSRPSLLFALGLFGVTAVALVLPVSPLARLFSFVPIPLTFYVFVIFLVGIYAVLVECLKYWFYRHYQL